MTTAKVDVPHRDIPRFQYWLASRTEEVTFRLSDKVERDGAGSEEWVRNGETHPPKGNPDPMPKPRRPQSGGKMPPSSGLLPLPA